MLNHLLTRRCFLSFVGTTSSCLAVAPTLLIPKKITHPSFFKNHERKISLYNIHTGESLSCTYWAQGRYDKAALTAIKKLFRDHRSHQQHAIDPSLLDILFSINQKLGNKKPFHLVSGYRSPQSNTWLTEHSNGVAQNSQHLYGKAADIYIETICLKTLQKTAKTLKAGGVGIYSHFIHVDTGPVRAWGEI